jgi:hypothetical protein
VVAVSLQCAELLRGNQPCAGVTRRAQPPPSCRRARVRAVGRRARALRIRRVTIEQLARKRDLGLPDRDVYRLEWLSSRLLSGWMLVEPAICWASETMNVESVLTELAVVYLVKGEAPVLSASRRT